jgi:lipoyl(octanoyl) transferase
LYGWEKPSVSLGYFQDIGEDVNIDACHRRGVDVVRRPTGGKAVLHGQDITYAVVAKDTHPLFPKDVLGTYRVISRCISEGLSKLGIRAHMAAEPRNIRSNPSQICCFSFPSQYELLVEGKKICGSAQARSHGTFLQHGSLLIDFNAADHAALLRFGGDPSRQIRALGDAVTSIRAIKGAVIETADLCRVLKSGFESILNIELSESPLSPEEETLGKTLLETKYLTDLWNMKGKVSGHEH